MLRLAGFEPAICCSRVRSLIIAVVCQRRNLLQTSPCVYEALVCPLC